MNHEDPATETVEKGTSRIPSLAFMGFAITAMAASAALMLTGRKAIGNFVGQWAPTILIMGLYNKVAKEIAVPKREQQQRLGSGIGAGLSTAHAGV